MLASLRGTDREREKGEGEKAKREREKGGRERERKSAPLYFQGQARHGVAYNEQEKVCTCISTCVRVLLHLTASPHLVGNVFCKPKYPGFAPLSRPGGYLTFENELSCSLISQIVGKDDIAETMGLAKLISAPIDVSSTILLYNAI